MSRTLQPEDFSFLVSVDAGRRYFLSSIDGRQVTGTLVLSAAQVMDYHGASRVCQGLRLRGYPQAIVKDLTGRPVTSSMFGHGADERPADSLPRTKADLDHIPAREFKRRMLSDPQFRARVDLIDAQAHTINC